VPNGDIFRVIREGKASVATDTIDTFTADGVRLSSGEELKADLIVTATGLDLLMLGGMTVSVDGKAYQPGEHLMYKATMLEGLPNAAMCFGYINASWTLKADIAAEYVCRVIAHMHEHGQDIAIPVASADERTTDTMLGKLSSGYIQRAAHLLPRQGKSEVWQVAHDYAFDRKLLQQMPIDDGVLQLNKSAGANKQPSRKLSQAA
jgi:cation diffusion facilitator CzcD-associated flavoprotein CzcO